MQPGDLVQLTDPKGRHHTFPLEAGRTFHTHKGALSHDDIIGSPEGIVVTTTSGVPYLVLRPLLRDFVLSMPRGATVVYPKDAAAIIGLADVFPGATVVEAGAGSGALTISLLRAVGPAGRVVSFERRADFAEVAGRNVARFLGGTPDNWELVFGDVQDLAHTGVHRMVLDMLAPWECIEAAASALQPGGILVAYVATTTQLSRMAESLRADGRFTEPEAQELLLRSWHLEGLAVRPEHRMTGHTGFLLATRRLAPGTVLPARRTRPAKGAYGQDYDGPAARPRGDAQGAGGSAGDSADGHPPAADRFRPRLP
jgi:tRNA (adenine57-N1/adenine58-N1)-methyltransferase